MWLYKNFIFLNLKSSDTIIIYSSYAISNRKWNVLLIKKYLGFTWSIGWAMVKVKVRSLSLVFSAFNKMRCAKIYNRNKFDEFFYKINLLQILKKQEILLVNNHLLSIKKYSCITLSYFLLVRLIHYSMIHNSQFAIMNLFKVKICYFDFR